MRKYQSISYSLLFIIISLFQVANLHPKPPRLTIVFIIDQLPYQTLINLYPHLRSGLKFFMDNGVNYVNTYVPHARPSTATAHVGLNTGTYAKDHGIIFNLWFDQQTNTMVESDNDTAVNAAVFSPEGIYDYGKSAHYIMVDGLSDQFVLQSKPDAPHQAVSIALKSRSAIGTANKLGKAIWFDDKTGFFTSSKAYFDKFPDWLQTFNKEKKINQLSHVQWKPAYPLDSPAYNFNRIVNYTYAKSTGLVGEVIPIEKQKSTPYQLFCRTPHANQLIFDLAREYVSNYMQQKPNNHLLLWVCLSSLDKVGHEYGPERIEAIDMLYHLDQQITHFINAIQKMIDPQEILFALTADHGTSPIVELLYEEGISFARRINEQQFIDQINSHIKNKYSVTDFVKALQLPNLYLDQSILDSFSPDTQKLIITDLKNFLRQQPGIKQVWTYEELHRACFSAQEIEDYFKKQLFLGRSGSLIIQVHPYVYLISEEKGADHVSPYNYDTHVPLILYQQGKLGRKKIIERVWLLQLA
ncbi:MAG TPA: hypothetical protein ENI08_01250, partial [Candidatus Dependentiae bacterium]|nr:hypothetical protein [Candidatus Dependentiae bacterium]